MGQVTVLALRAVIAALLAGSLAVQTVMVPLLASDLNGLDERYAYVRTPLLAVVVLIVLAAQTVLICVWRLVTMARRGTVFSYAAFRYVHIVIGAFVAAALLVFTLGALLAPGRPSRPASCSWSAGSAWRSWASRSSSSSCGCCSPRPWRGSWRPPGCGPSWPR